MRKTSGDGEKTNVYEKRKDDQSPPRDQAARKKRKTQTVMEKYLVKEKNVYGETSVQEVDGQESETGGQ